MKKLFATLVVFAALLLSGCTFVDTGEVGLKRNFDKTIDTTEVLAGDFRQTLVGELLTFPVKDVSVDVKDLQPLAADNSTMKDFDVTVVYSLNPSSVSDLWINKSRSFHAMTAEGETLLMYEYIKQTARNAVYKTARNYKALAMNDNRASIENEIRKEIVDTFADEKLTGINITQVQVRAMVPSDVVRASSDNLVRAENEEKTKAVEVRNAKLEAERIAALNANKGAIDYMDAQSRQMMAQAMLQGKVNTIVIPADFKGIVNAGTK